MTKKIRKGTFYFLIFGFLLSAAGCAAPKKFAESPEAVALAAEFPFLAKLLSADHPWEMEPADLAGLLFERTPVLKQGSEDYPLLFTDMREGGDGWPGEKVFGQFAYEIESYAFDRVNPVLKLHIGRPLLHSQQHGRVEERARSREGSVRFPFLEPEEVPVLLGKLDSMVLSLKRYGAKKMESNSYLATVYRLPNDVVLTVTNLTGSTNGTPYVELMLTPRAPVKKFEGTQTLAFPGAEGYGRFSRGGRGGKVYVVTSLEDYLPKGRQGRREGRYGQPSEHALTLGEGNWIPYTDALGEFHPGVGRPLLPAFPAIEPEEVIHGTLREALEAEGPRYVVFAVSGDIELKSNLVIDNPYVTIAGQTAPGSGVQIKNWGLVINTHDVIVRHLRIRVGETKGPGDLQRTLGEQTHALDANAMNVIIDHCDIAYANDQVFNTYGAYNRLATTIQWSYIYGAPKKSTHEKGNHSMMMTGNGWGFVSFHHNMLAHGERRNPRLDMLHYDYRNNILYNFTGTGYGSDNDYLRLNYIGNTVKKGPDSKKTHLQAFAEKTLYGQWYGEDNALPDDFTGVFGCPPEVIVPKAHPAAPVTTHRAGEAFRLVIEQGGATKPVRDEITEYVARTAREGTGTIPDTPDDWPGKGFAKYPAAAAPDDANGNGIPDAWEVRNGLDPAKSSATGKDLHPEYDNIEMYINSL